MELTLQQISDAFAGARFFRNTHIGPNFKEFRPDLMETVTEESALESEEFTRPKKLNGWTFHLCSHEKGLTFEQIYQEVTKYYEQNQDDFNGGCGDVIPTPSPEDIWEDIKNCLKETVMRVEF